MPTSVDLSHNWFGLPCGYTLSRLRKAQDGASLAMCPSVAFSFHTQGNVSKGRRLLSDAPFGRYTEALARRRLRIRGEIFLSFLVKLCFRKRPFRSTSRTTDFGCLVAIPFRG